MLPLPPRLGAFDSDRNGVSIVEILFVILALSILASIALPDVQNGLSRTSVNNSAATFNSRVGLARSSAVRMGSARLIVDTLANRYWVEADTSGAGDFSLVSTAVDLSDDRVNMQADFAALCFDGRGLGSSVSSGCASGPSTIVFSRGSFVDSVRVTSIGKVLR